MQIIIYFFINIFQRNYRFTIKGSLIFHEKDWFLWSISITIRLKLESRSIFYSYEAVKDYMYMTKAQSEASHAATSCNIKLDVNMWLMVSYTNTFVLIKLKKHFINGTNMSTNNQTKSIFIIKILNLFEKFLFAADIPLFFSP